MDDMLIKLQAGTFNSIQCMTLIRAAQRGNRGVYCCDLSEASYQKVYYIESSIDQPKCQSKHKSKQFVAAIVDLGCTKYVCQRTRGGDTGIPFDSLVFSDSEEAARSLRCI